MLPEEISYGKVMVKVRRSITWSNGILKVQNQSLLLKWLWRLAADDRSLWKEIIIARYRREGPRTTKEVKNPYGVGLWRTIRNQWPNCGVTLKSMWEKVETLFWNDIWVGHTPLRLQFPDIYNLNQQKLATILRSQEFTRMEFDFQKVPQ